MGERSDEGSGSRRSFGRLVRKEVGVLLLAGMVMLLATAGALAVTGDLTQPAGVAGCVSEEGTGPCADGHELGQPLSVAVSPDGKSVYVASYYPSNAVVRLNRNPTTGAIAQPAGAAGCVSQDGFGSCAAGHALDFPYSVAVSPDGKNVYVASYSSNAVARLNRNPTTGALTQPAGAAGCVSQTGAGPCADGHALVYPHSVAVSPDGKSVYSTSGGSKAVVRFNRAP
jgi:DNA-binding beta-propeller fold protein YncE